MSATPDHSHRRGAPVAPGPATDPTGVGREAEIAGQLRGLAREVDGLRHRIDELLGTSHGEELAARLGRLSGEVDQLRSGVRAAVAQGEGLDDLAEQVQLLTDQLLAGAGDRTATGSSPVAWSEVAAEDAPGVLVDLADWIGRVLTHYELAQALTPCWYRHPDLVQTLLNANAAWNMAYRESGDVAWALDLDQRHLPHLAAQITKILRGCASGQHLVWPSPDALATDEGSLREYAQWWATGHGADREPAPSTSDPHSPLLPPKP